MTQTASRSALVAAFGLALPIALAGWGAAAQPVAQPGAAAPAADPAATAAGPDAPAAARAEGSASAAGSAATTRTAAPAPLFSDRAGADRAPDPGESAALAAALRGAVEALDDPEIAAVYAAGDHLPIWIDADRPERSVVGLIAAFEGADTHGLPPVADAADLRARLAGLEGLDGPARFIAVAALDVALSRAAVDYGVALASGALTPRKVDGEIHVDPARPDRALLLKTLAEAPEPRRALEAMAPADPGYAALRARLAAFRDLVANGGWQEEAPDARVLRLGDRGREVWRLQARLHELGDAPAPAPVQLAASSGQAIDAGRPAVLDAEFDLALEDAVKRFQTRHGLNADGVAGRRTFEALEASAEQRMRQIAVNLERMRWMNKDLGDRRIMVNQADFRMQVVLDGEVAQEMRVVIGLARNHRTPEFSDVMTHMVVNPTWNVPYSIATKEIVPALRRNPNHLAEQNMSLLTRGGDPTGLDPTLMDWTEYGPGNFPFRIRQSPGPHNALGQVKFMFPNNFAIYLHDTPSRSLFAKDERAFSHGCVRVERPIELAHLLLEGQVDDPAGRFAGWQARAEEIWVKIRNPLQVHLFYRTAWVDPETGRDEFRHDVYGRDATVWAALDKAGLTL